jgi:signal transduction histidine kinase
MEMRRSKVRGFVYAPFRAGNFFSEVERTVGSDDIAFEVYDTSVDPQNLLSKSLTVSDTDVGRKSIWSHLSSTSEIEVAGRKWVVLNTTGESFASQSILWWTPLVAFVGFALTGILFAMTRRQAASREKLRSVAAELFVSEREKHRLLVREQETREAAETANVVKDEFLSVVSHELRTPLNAIAGWARVLRSPEVSPLMRESALDKVERNLKQQSSLVEDLITFSQIASRSLVLEREAVDLSSAVRSVLAELEPISVEKQISMVLQDPDGAVGVAGDAERIRLCIMKLVSNALKFTPNGGHVEVVVKAEEGFAELHVTDSGQGISQEFLPYVFEHFKQHDSSTTRKFAGLGLGLTIAERIIGLHGGTISVSSEGEGKGAEFTVRLPR